MLQWVNNHLLHKASRVFTHCIFLCTYSQKLISYCSHVRTKSWDRINWSHSRWHISCISSLAEHRCCAHYNKVHLSAGSHSPFVMVNKIREYGVSRLSIDLSSSAVTMKENEQRALKKQLSLLLAVIFSSGFPRYIAVDAVNITLSKVFLLNNIDDRGRLETDPLTPTTHSFSLLPTETRKEGKYNHHRKRSFFSKIALNLELILAEYTAPINKEYLNGRLFAPEDIIVAISPTFSPHISASILHLAEQRPGKIVGFGVTKRDETADPASLLTLASHGINLSSSSSYLR